LGVTRVADPARARKVVGEEHVRGGGQFVEKLLALGCRQIDADASFAAIGVMHQHAAFGAHRQTLQHLDAALGLAAHGVLDLDHVGPQSERTAPAAGT
jgi:hypothetical protein